LKGRRTFKAVLCRIWNNKELSNSILSFVAASGEQPVPICVNIAAVTGNEDNHEVNIKYFLS